MVLSLIPVTAPFLDAFEKVLKNKVKQGVARLRKCLRRNKVAPVTAADAEDGKDGWGGGDEGRGGGEMMDPLYMSAVEQMMFGNAASDYDLKAIGQVICICMCVGGCGCVVYTNDVGSAPCDYDVRVIGEVLCMCLSVCVYCVYIHAHR